jgi:anti-sigma factor RsiW
MKCSYPQNDIALYVEGDLPPARARDIEGHLTSCSACRELLTDLRESQAVLKELRQDTVHPAALSSVRSRVLAEIDGTRWRPVWGRWVYALSGGLFLLMISVGWLLNIGKPPATPVEDSLSSNALPSADAVQPSVGTGTVPEPIAKAVTEPKGIQTRPVVKANRRVRLHEVAVKAQQPVNANISAEPPKQVVVKLMTDDPNIVIYWLLDAGGTL